MNTKIKAILGLATISMLIYTTYEQYNTINTLRAEKAHLDSLVAKQDQMVPRTELDSLQTELLSTQIINGRYELGLDYLKERNLKEYLVVKHFIDTKTE